MNVGTCKTLFSDTDFDNSTTPGAEGEDWATPQTVFDDLDAEFHFTLDAAASAWNHKCDSYFTKEQDALTQVWAGTVFCNPPYGKTIKDWLAKGRAAAQNGATVVFLIHARTDTKWFHDHVYQIADEIRFVKGRLKFKSKTGVKNSAPFPSMIVVYRPSESHGLIQ